MHVKSGTLGFSQDSGLFVEYAQQEAAIHAEPGDLLVHHSMTIHRANGNQSNSRHRRAMGMVHYSAQAKVDSAQVERYQQVW